MLTSCPNFQPFCRRISRYLSLLELHFLDNIGLSILIPMNPGLRCRSTSLLHWLYLLSPRASHLSVHFVPSYGRSDQSFQLCKLPSTKARQSQRPHVDHDLQTARRGFPASRFIQLRKQFPGLLSTFLYLSFRQTNHLINILEVLLLLIQDISGLL